VSIEQKLAASIMLPIVLFLGYCVLLLLQGLGVFMVSEFIPAMVVWDTEKWVAFSVLLAGAVTGFWAVFLREG
jgi:hypothetical protein